MDDMWSEYRELIRTLTFKKRTMWRDPFNQNFRKFWFKTKWIGLVQQEKFQQISSTFQGGRLFSVGSTRLKQTLPFDHTSLFSVFHVQHGGRA